MLSLAEARLDRLVGPLLHAIHAQEEGSMEKAKCKHCGKRHDLREPHELTGESGPSRFAPGTRVTAGVTKARYPGTIVTQTVTPGPGEECPTCGQKMPMTHAQRQAAYRSRTPAESANL